MEERQIQEFVHRISCDEALRKELISDPEQVIACEDFSPAVARVLMKLVPNLSLGAIEGLPPGWWF
ncbi:MAG TPA: hypothetical protein VEL31_08780 [Ktedonobacteraceae bacterium]|nr:hypothetical protein [Ktedonobacteraceae bacterium]